jgi:hypothetical protein
MQTIHQIYWTSQLSLIYLKRAQTLPDPTVGQILETQSLFYTNVLNYFPIYTDGHFVDMMACENTKYNIQKTLATQHTVQSWLFCSPHAHMANWELQLEVEAQHYKRVSYCTLLAQEEIQIPSIFSTERV